MERFTCSVLVRLWSRGWLRSGRCASIVVGAVGVTASVSVALGAPVQRTTAGHGAAGSHGTAELRELVAESRKSGALGNARFSPDVAQACIRLVGFDVALPDTLKLLCNNDLTLFTASQDPSGDGCYQATVPAPYVSSSAADKWTLLLPEASAQAIAPIANNGSNLCAVSKLDFGVVLIDRKHTRRVKLEDAAGAPVPGEVLTCRQWEPPLSKTLARAIRPTQSPRRTFAVTGSNGVAQFAKLPTGPLHLRAENGRSTYWGGSALVASDGVEPHFARGVAIEPKETVEVQIDDAAFLTRFRGATVIAVSVEPPRFAGDDSYSHRVAAGVLTDSETSELAIASIDASIPRVPERLIVLHPQHGVRELQVVKSTNPAGTVVIAVVDGGGDSAAGDSAAGDSEAKAKSSLAWSGWPHAASLTATLEPLLPEDRAIFQWSGDVASGLRASVPPCEVPCRLTLRSKGVLLVERRFPDGVRAGELVDIDLSERVVRGQLDSTRIDLLASGQYGATVHWSAARTGASLGTVPVALDVDRTGTFHAVLPKRSYAVADLRIVCRAPSEARLYSFHDVTPGDVGRAAGQDAVYVDGAITSDLLSLGFAQVVLVDPAGHRSTHALSSQGTFKAALRPDQSYTVALAGAPKGCECPASIMSEPVLFATGDSVTPLPNGAVVIGESVRRTLVHAGNPAAPLRKGDRFAYRIASRNEDLGSLAWEPTSGTDDSSDVIGVLAMSRGLSLDEVVVERWPVQSRQFVQRGALVLDGDDLRADFEPLGTWELRPSEDGSIARAPGAATEGSIRYDIKSVDSSAHRVERVVIQGNERRQIGLPVGSYEVTPRASDGKGAPMSLEIRSGEHSIVRAVADRSRQRD